MTLVVEDGTALDNAEAYISAADADTYHTNRGNTGWTGTQADKEAALRKAAEFMVQSYRERWKGWRKSVTQALDWPRYGVQLTDTYQGAMGYYQYPWTQVPEEVKRANAELALRALTAPLLADLPPPTASETVGPISVSYFQGDRQTTAYPAVDQSLSAFLQNSGGLVVERC